jgi:SpoVK/Ycf46/Vps4 family AAA+-type ATPase
MMSWIAEETIKRVCQNTCVFLLHTRDKARTDQARKWIVKLMNAKDGEQLTFTRGLEFDIQRQELLDIGNKLSVVEPSTLQTIDQQLLDGGTAAQPKRTAVLIHNVFLQSHADSLSDYLAAWAQDGRIFNNGGTITVVTANVSLFPEPLREMCHTISLYPPSTEEERLAVAQQVVKNLKDNLNPVELKKLDLRFPANMIEQSRGLSPSEMQTAVMESTRTLGKIDPAKFTEIKAAKFRAQGREYMIPTTGYEALAVPEYVKALIQNAVAIPLKDPEKAKRYGLTLPKGIIVVGPPGTGKTALAETLAYELKWPMIKVVAADLYKSHVGESEAALRDFFRDVEANVPCAVFIDEIDAILPVRGTVMATDSGVNRRLTNGMLEELGDSQRRSFIIAATNRIGDVDPAAVRPGRFDYIVPILYPDQKGRMQIIKIHCTVRNHLPIDDSVKTGYEELAKLSAWMSGADIAKWCLDTARYAMEQNQYPVTIDHFKEVRKWTDINVTERQRELEELTSDMQRLKSGVNKRIWEQAIEEFTQSGSKDEADRLKAFTEGFTSKAAV